MPGRIEGTADGLHLVGLVAGDVGAGAVAALVILLLVAGIIAARQRRRTVYYHRVNWKD